MNRIVEEHCRATRVSKGRFDARRFSQNGSILEPVMVISRKAIVGFGRVHKDAELPLDAWYRTVLRARWGNLTRARKDFPHADAVGERTVSNVGATNTG